MNMNIAQRMYGRKDPFTIFPQALMYLRLYPIETRIYRTNGRLCTVLVPNTDVIPVRMTEIVCSENDKIRSLISQGVLVPDIVSDKEYKVQHAVGSVEHRTYRLQSKIAAKYQFVYNTLMTLSTIEYMITLCDYNIFEAGRGLRVDGQKYLEIIPKNSTVVCDYQGNVITPENTKYCIDQSSFDDMVSRGIIILRGTKWKLSRNYWEFKL